MKINEVIRMHRIETGMTQEQLAGRLGVTAPAVNKWEKGNSYPDITILPVLARVLNTDLNTLLSFQNDLSMEEIAQFLNELAKTLQEKGYQAAENMAKDKLKEYPNCYQLLLNVGMVLEGFAAMNNEAEEVKAGVHLFAQGLYERAADSPEQEVRDQALFLIISECIDKKEYEKAEKLLKELPGKNFADKRMLQIKLYTAQGKTEEAAKMEEMNLLTSLNDVHTALLGIMEGAVAEDRMDDAQSVVGIIKNMVLTFGMWDYFAHGAALQFAIASRNEKACLESIRNLKNCCSKKWSMDHPVLYRHINTKGADSEILEQIWGNIADLIETDESMEFFRDSDSYSLLDLNKS